MKGLNNFINEGKDTSKVQEVSKMNERKELSIKQVLKLIKKASEDDIDRLFRTLTKSQAKDVESMKKGGGSEIGALTSILADEPGQHRVNWLKNRLSEHVNEASKMKDVTKKMWDKMSDDEQEEALLSAASDPDATEKFIGFKWEDLPSWVTSMMVIDESEETELTESEKEITFDVDFYDSTSARKPFETMSVVGTKKKGFKQLVKDVEGLSKGVGASYTEIYYNESFIGSMDKRDSYKFKMRQKYSDSPLKESIDYSEEDYWDKIPKDIMAIIQKYSDDDGETYNNLKKLKKELNKKGWDTDYGLDGSIYDLGPLDESKVINESTKTINKKVHKELGDYLIDTKDPKQYQYDVKEILKFALIDANFPEIANGVDTAFPSAKNSHIQDISTLYRMKGQEIAKMGKWDAIDILNAISHHLYQSMGKETAQRLDSLKSKFFN